MGGGGGGPNLVVLALIEDGPWAYFRIPFRPTPPTSDDFPSDSGWDQEILSQYLSVKSPALILSKNLGVSLAKNQLKSAKIGLRSAKNWPKIG